MIFIFVYASCVIMGMYLLSFNQFEAAMVIFCSIIIGLLASKKEASK
jgi:hypothetical protein